MLDFILSNLLIATFIFIPIAVVLTGIAGGLMYVLYLLMKDMLPDLHNLHHKESH